MKHRDKPTPNLLAAFTVELKGGSQSGPFVVSDMVDDIIKWYSVYYGNVLTKLWGNGGVSFAGLKPYNAQGTIMFVMTLKGKGLYDMGDGEINMMIRELINPTEGVNRKLTINGVEYTVIGNDVDFNIIDTIPHTWKKVKESKKPVTMLFEFQVELISTCQPELQSLKYVEQIVDWYEANKRLKYDITVDGICAYSHRLQTKFVLTLTGHKLLRLSEFELYMLLKSIVNPDDSHKNLILIDQHKYLVIGNHPKRLDKVPSNWKKVSNGPMYVSFEVTINEYKNINSAVHEIVDWYKRYIGTSLTKEWGANVMIESVDAYQNKKRVEYVMKISGKGLSTMPENTKKLMIRWLINNDATRKVPLYINGKKYTIRGNPNTYTIFDEIPHNWKKLGLEYTVSEYIAFDVSLSPSIQLNNEVALAIGEWYKNYTGTKYVGEWVRDVSLTDVGVYGVRKGAPKIVMKFQGKGLKSMTDGNKNMLYHDMIDPKDSPQRKLVFKGTEYVVQGDIHTFEIYEKVPTTWRKL
jgi:hypothetical protein